MNVYWTKSDGTQGSCPLYVSPTRLSLKAKLLATVPRIRISR